MFSFHKPKVYRSTTGCCICKAKSSSSRFTDSKKYEIDFIECFQLEVPRRGEICNACVLLVKRFKRLPAGSERHWGHVVDARVGPGLKSMTKFKKRKEEEQKMQDGINAEKCNSKSSVPERFCKIFKKKKKQRNTDSGLKIQIKKDCSSDDNLSPTSPVSTNSDFDDLSVNGNFKVMARKYRRKNPRPVKNYQSIASKPAEFIDTDFWQKRQTCCGFVYENQVYGALIVDIDSFQLCVKHKKPVAKILSPKKTEISAPHLTNLHINAKKFSNGINKIAKVSDLFNTNTSAVKKHHLYSKASSNATAAALQPQQLLFDDPKTGAGNKKTELSSQAMASPTVVAKTALLATNGTGNVLTRVDKFLHRLKTDVSGKINKSLSTKNDRIMLVKAVNNTDMNIGKLCTDKTVVVRNKLNSLPTEAINGNGVAPTAAKFLSDNSSDSGYEEIQDQNQKNLQASVCELLLRCPETLDQPMASPTSNGNSSSTTGNNLKLTKTYNLNTSPTMITKSKSTLISPNEEQQRKSCLVKFY